MISNFLIRLHGGFTKADLQKIQQAHVEKIEKLVEINRQNNIRVGDRVYPKNNVNKALKFSTLYVAEIFIGLRGDKCFTLVNKPDEVPMHYSHKVLARDVSLDPPKCCSECGSVI